MIYHFFYCLFYFQDLYEMTNDQIQRMTKDPNNENIVKNVKSISIICINNDILLLIKIASYL